MKNMKNYITKFSTKEKGATMVEYAIMVALIAIVSIAMITGLGKNVNTTFSTVNSAINSANGG